MIFGHSKTLLKFLTKNEKKIRITQVILLMKGNENIWLFLNDSYQEVSIDWLTVTLKYDNHDEVASNVVRHP